MAHPNRQERLLPATPASYLPTRSYLGAIAVMEYVAGQTLEAKLAAAGGPLPEQEVLEWAVQLCDVLEFLHSHNPPIIFRDLKPPNIMLRPDGQIVLIDFGIARLFKPGQKTEHKHNWGEVESRLGMGMMPDPRWFMPWWKGPGQVYFRIENLGPRGYLSGQLEALDRSWLTVPQPEFGCWPGDTAEIVIAVDKQKRKLRGITPELFNLVIN